MIPRVVAIASNGNCRLRMSKPVALLPLHFQPLVFETSLFWICKWTFWVNCSTRPIFQHVGIAGILMLGGAL